MRFVSTLNAEGSVPVNMLLHRFLRARDRAENTRAIEDQRRCVVSVEMMARKQLFASYALMRRVTPRYMRTHRSLRFVSVLSSDGTVPLSWLLDRALRAHD